MVPRYKEKEERRSDATSVIDPLFFDGLRLDLISIAEAILRRIIPNSPQPIYITKLSTEFSLRLDWGLVWLPMLPPRPGGVARRDSRILLGFGHAAALLCSLSCFFLLRWCECHHDQV